MTRLFGIDPDEDRLRIRALRACPSGRAHNDEKRRRVFAAALGQFDELLTASAAVGPATRPLPLYYPLNQAGRAIAAAHQQADRPWEPRSHGLTIGDPDSKFLWDTTITPSPRNDGRDSFGILTESTNSSRLTEPTMLSNIWAAIPNSPRPGLGAGCPRAIPLEVSSAAQTVTAATIRGLKIPPTSDPKDRVKEIIEDLYPKAATGLVVDQVTNDHPRYMGARVELSWHHPGPNGDNGGPPRVIAKEITPYLTRGGVGAGWWLIPRVNKVR
jgi:hypothetical protein